MRPLNEHEKKLLVRLINIMDANEWSDGDYNFTQKQHDALMNAKRKLEGEEDGR